MIANRKPVYSLISIIAVVVLIIVLSSLEKIEYSMEGSFLVVHTPIWSDISIDVDQIKSVKLRDDIKVGSRAGGYGSAKLGVGNFKNEEFGRYTLYHFNNCNLLVQIEMYDGSVIVLGDFDSSTTEALYEMIVNR